MTPAHQHQCPACSARQWCSRGCTLPVPQGEPVECESCFYARCGPFSEGRGDEALALARRLRDRLRDYPGWFSFICPDCTVHRGEHEADCAVAELMRDTAADLAEAKRVLDPAKEVDRG